MLTITPIGSCRITAPLRLCRSSHGFRLNMARTYGYCHSSAEAVQYLRFLKGEFAPDPTLWPLISLRPSYEVIAAQDHVASDLYVIELCSAKMVRVGEQCIQLNYLQRAFRPFFKDKERALAFNRLAIAGDGEALGAWLDTNWSATPRQIEDSRILRQVRIEMVSEATLTRDVHTLMEEADEVLFVTHVDALTEAGTSVPGRGAFIEMVKSVCRRLGARVYEPTALMREFGQSAAIEDYSTSLAHFTDDFSRRVLDDWYEHTIHDMIERKMLDNPDDTIPRILVPHVKAFLASGEPERLEDIAVLLDAAEVYFPDNAALKRMQRVLAVGVGQSKYAPVG